ncbi:MAG: hypothetical protein OXC98_01060 [bacterium]|nr:hypothetical protein [Acidimicrobiia bacterium]MCY4648946.1 hypothetical protein [bacterium]
MKRANRVKWLTVVVVASLAASCGDQGPDSTTSTVVVQATAELTGADGGTETTAATTTSTTTTIPPPPVEDLLFVPESFRDRLVELVEETQMLRGLAFTNPLPIEAVTSQEIERRLRSRVEDDPDLSELYQSLFRLLGLIDAETDWVSVLAGLRSRPTPAFYDAADQVLWLASTLEQPTPFEEMILVGEIAKALVDHNLDTWTRLERLGGTGDSDSLTAWEAMAEADAILVELLFLEGLTEAAQQEVTEHAWMLSVDGEALPSFVEGSLRFASGPTLDYLQRLFQLGGWDLINDTHDEPPASTEHILSLGVGQLVPVLLPRPGVSAPEGYQEVSDAVWGQWGWETLLSSALGPERAFPAAWGWGGDRYLLFSDGSEVALVVDYIGDTAEDTEEMRVALAEFIQDRMAVGEGRWREGGNEYYDDDYAWLSGEGELLTFIAATDVTAGRDLRSSRGG